MSTKRLFLFAGYAPNGVIDAALVYYVRALSALGDVILIMDSDCNPCELDKVRPYVKHAGATRHGEYDFGSYKRAYIWACENMNIADYDFVYMANDSVYGPLYPLRPIIQDLESQNLDAFGMVCNPKPSHPHIQSWFIGMRKSVFLSDWFDAFIRSVTKLESKGLITRMYEHRFSSLVTENGLTWHCPWTAKNRGVYNRIKYLYCREMPFIKKVAFTRHGGSLGRQIKYVLDHAPHHARNAILSAACETWGAEYISWLLTKNPITIMIRTVRHTIKKIFTEGI